MFKIHKKVKYALIALKHISAQKPEYKVTAKEICTKFSIPFDPTSRVLQLMAQQGVLKVEQGVHGGYGLKGDLDRLSVYALSQMVVGGLAVTDCVGDEVSCERAEHCVLKGAMTKLNLKVIKAFNDVMVSEMIG